MILKIKAKVAGWVFHDGISKILIGERIEARHDKKEGGIIALTKHETWFVPFDGQKFYPEHGEIRLTEDDSKFILLPVLLNDEKTVFINTPAYLLNDSGETIEKLN